ncbi:MAG TPA: phosphatase PAP2 family protein [Ktedonobacteraceae bacterium]|nr:phosphatase PAP2 family protein [Ktedonobacteraceae bacterium]
MQLKRIPTSRLWFLAALVLLALFGIFTIIFSTGVLLYPTLHIEQWLLHRPLTAIDCVFVEWKQLGEVGASLLGTLVLGGVCVLLGYRRRMLPFLFLLLLLGVGVEYGGKQYFPQVVPANTQFGMNSLACPQMWGQSRSTKIMVALGMWWKAPPARPVRIRNEQFSATAPLIIDDNARLAYGYPSGHAMRWFFMGFVAFWLAWRHVKFRLLRLLLMAIALAAAFGGGFAQFYIGVHLSTDLIAGYLLGASLACCAIGLLLLNEKKDKRQTAQAQDQLDEAQKVSMSSS